MLTLQTGLQSKPCLAEPFCSVCHLQTPAATRSKLPCMRIEETPLFQVDTTSLASLTMSRSMTPTRSREAPQAHGRPPVFQREEALARAGELGSRKNGYFISSDSKTPANPNSPDFSDCTVFRIHLGHLHPFVDRPAKGISPWWNLPNKAASVQSSWIQHHLFTSSHWKRRSLLESVSNSTTLLLTLPSTKDRR
ncbi:hypothetical protein K443DRAFT_438411 [Laccaria amethystina LaAM-08-1]|uniref:Uncharacterized protein n=1 Tax=Laccaria amethystina LaAM-08-1 TaxID=1095629 RepID=A0A0C9X3X5_9AGAR|nr:hypothetical protein K443DRAFT_438411 [Laccaria amethystina LaAM-08-1]